MSYKVTATLVGKPLAAFESAHLDKQARASATLKVSLTLVAVSRGEALHMFERIVVESQGASWLPTGLGYRDVTIRATGDKVERRLSEVS